MRISVYQIGQWAVFGLVGIIGTGVIWWLAGYLIAALLFLVAIALRVSVVLICIIWWIFILSAFLELRDEVMI